MKKVDNTTQNSHKTMLKRVTDMETTTKLNSMQLFMLRIFDRPVNVTQEKEIKKLIADYFAKQIDEEMDKIWETKKMTQNDLDEMLDTHQRTPYK
ncbi:MAG: hypothetical protein EAZ22_01025 [Cytophagales bacterium]|nr:MAG: hypothetical protein EAZ38_03585 [Cytophagales bacterium]TAG84179.1 MAG: hypothetical protein EAZ22_01025 [Cytophagales bacterium]